MPDVTYFLVGGHVPLTDISTWTFLGACYKLFSALAALASKVHKYKLVEELNHMLVVHHLISSRN